MSFLRSNKIKSQVNKIFWITISWTFISIFQFTNGYAAIMQFCSNTEGLDSSLVFISSIVTGIIAGILGGSGVVFLWEKWLRTRGYGWTLTSMFLSYTIIYLVVALPSNYFYISNLKKVPIYDPSVTQEVFGQLFSLGQLNNYVYWLIVILGTLIVLLVNDKYGPGMFRSFLLGKYFHPKREERIFMFLDLRSSTRIAERLGEEYYFNFIKDVFKHVTPSIIYSKGEIYQYVGDEIVITWVTKKGIENANCIRCFFEIQRTLRQKASYYLEAYGVEPEFKAGLHYGNVMAGEVGVVKRDIAFSGDVLNTAARIQSKCNELGVNILISKFLLEKLALPPNSFEPRKIGDMMLRGKNQQVVLFTV